MPPRLPRALSGRPGRIPRRALVVATAASLTLGGAGLAAASTGSTLTALPTTVLAGDVLPGLSALTPLHPTSPTQRVQVDLALQRPDVAGELAAYKAMYTPGSPSYHRFFTPETFAARFGVPAARYDAAKSWATAQGLTLVRSSAARDVLVLSGTAAQVEKTFSVQLADYRSDGLTYYANAAAPKVPSTLGVTGVLGLNSKLRSRTFHSTPAANAPHGAAPAQDTCQGGTCLGYTTPQDLWSIYDQPATDTGQGQTMAVFGEGQTDPVITNLRTFEGLHHLPQVPVKVVHADGPDADYSDNTGEVEWDLDTQSSTGMAPDVQGETLYFGSDLTDASVLNVFSTWASDPNGPLQANASYGECEEDPVGDAAAAGYPYSAGAEYTVKSEDILRQAVMQGRTLFASTGDTGSTCPLLPVNVNGVGYEVPGVNYPASSPYVVGVGGTVLYGTDTSDGSAAQRSLEYSWTYTGGGSSVTFAKPDYQAGIPQIAGVCLTGPGGDPSAAGQPCRGIPDVAAQSGDVATNGYGIVAEGQTNYPGGGTSLSSPLTMGMWTRIQAAAKGVTTTTEVPCPTYKPNGRIVKKTATATCTQSTTTYPGNGFANESFYAHPADFFDIGGGTQSPPTGNGSYVSTPGWDYTSGLGALDVSKLAQDIAGSTTPANPLPAPCPYGDTTCSSSGGGAGGGVVGGPKPAGAVLWTDPVGDDAYVGDPAGSGSNPQLDLVSGNLTDDGTTLHATLTLADLSTAAPSAAGGANDYYLLWTYKGTQYFASAEVDALTGTVTYGDGTVSGNQFTTGNTDTGTFVPGKNGTITVDVPLAHVGSPAAGDTLVAPAGQSRVLLGSTVTGGLIEQADVGGPQYDYVLGTGA